MAKIADIMHTQAPMTWELKAVPVENLFKNI